MTFRASPLALLLTVCLAACATETASTSSGGGADDEGDASVPDAEGTSDGDGADAADGDAETSGGAGAGENNARCEENTECMSGKCHKIPVIGGWCSECLDDSDCPDGGCNVPVSGQDLGAVCNDGSLGGGCKESSSCQSGKCEIVINTGGVFDFAGCSECASDSDCSGGKLCAPVLDFPESKGHKECVDPGTRGSGELCDAAGSGDQACEGLCTEATYIAFTIAVCGECRSDGDCSDPAKPKCDGSVVDLMAGTFDGSACVAG